MQSPYASVPCLLSAVTIAHFPRFWWPGQFCSETGLPRFVVNTCLLFWNSPVRQIFDTVCQRFLPIASWSCGSGPFACFYLEVHGNTLSPSFVVNIAHDFSLLLLKYKVYMWKNAIVQLRAFSRLSTSMKAVPGSRCKTQRTPQKRPPTPVKANIIQAFNQQILVSLVFGLHTNGLIEYILFCVWLFSFSIMFIKFSCIWHV